MADEKISELDAAGTLTGAEVIPVLQGGDNARTTLALAAAYTNNLLSLTTSFGFTPNAVTLVGHTFAQMRADLDLEAGTDFYPIAATDAAIAAVISDTAYDATSWNSVTTIAPSKNAVRDKLEAMTADGAVTRAMLATSASQRIMGRASSGVGAVEDMTPAQVRRMLAMPVNLVADYNCPTDGTSDCGPAIQAAYNAAGTYGLLVEVPPGRYSIQTAVTGASEVVFFGLGGKPEPDNNSGAIFVNDISGNNSAINFPGTTHDWGFESIGFDGNDKNAPFINVTETGSSLGYGAYGVRFDNCVAESCRPWIYAEYSFDWVINGCDTNLCGNAATGTGSQVASLYFYNSDVNEAGANCNNIRFLECFIDVSTGYGIYSDSSGAGHCNVNFYIGHCHFEKHSGTGYPGLIGDLSGSDISSNLFHQIGGIAVDLTNVSTEAGANRVALNRFFNATSYSVRTAGSHDIIALNNSYKADDTVPHFNLTATAFQCRVIENQINTGTGSNVAVDDDSFSAIIFGNNDNLTVDDGTVAVKLFGTQYYAPVSTTKGDLPLADSDGSHLLSLSCSSDLTANRTLSLATGDADRTLTLSGNPTLGDWFDQAVKAASSPMFTGIELGHASDTTLTRIAAGRVAIEGAEIGRLSATQTWTGAQTFTASNFIISNASAILTIIESDATADSGRWRFLANGNQLRLDVVNDANSVADPIFTIFRTGAAVTSIAYGCAVNPDTSNTFALGTTSLMWSDLFLGSGAVVNFNNGDVTITHASNILTFAGASSGYFFDAAPKPVTDNGAAIGSIDSRWSDAYFAAGAVIYFGDTDVTLTHSTDALTFWGGDFQIASTFRLWLNDSQSTVGAAGAASALPANPTGYIPIKVGGTEYVLPYYAKA